MDRFRLIDLKFRIQILIVFVATQLGRFQLIPTIFFLIILEAVYFSASHFIENFNLNANKYWEDEDKNFNRKLALQTAKVFLSPYKNIWKNLKLSNKYCSVKLGNYPSEIRVSEKVHPYRHFDVIKSYVHDYEFLWNKFCLNFAHNTTYDEMVRNCRIYQVSIQETIGIVTNEKPESQIERSAAQVDETQVINVEKPVQKVDINNCSEVELTELPGINIVKAKKIIKKREAINGFKSIKEFFNFVQLKPNFQSQLENRIEIKKKQGTLKQERYSERKLDF